MQSNRMNKREWVLALVILVGAAVLITTLAL